jgi:hypothetical protein
VKAPDCPTLLQPVRFVRRVAPILHCCSQDVKIRAFVRLVVRSARFSFPPAAHSVKELNQACNRFVSDIGLDSLSVPARG